MPDKKTKEEVHFLFSRGWKKQLKMTHYIKRESERESANKLWVINNPGVIQSVTYLFHLHEGQTFRANEIESLYISSSSLSTQR